MSLNEVVARGFGASVQDGIAYTALGGKNAETITSDLHGKWYSQNYRGQVYHGSTPAAGVAVPISTTTAPVFTLWNPAGSGKNFELIKLDVGTVTLGTRVVSDFVLMQKTGCGSTIATGGVITAFAATPNSVFSGIVGAASQSVASFSSAGTVTLATAATIFKNLPFSHDLASGGSLPVMTYDFDGTVIIPPGVAVHIASNGAATGSTYGITLSWAEVAQ